MGKPYLNVKLKMQIAKDDLKYTRTLRDRAREDRDVGFSGLK